MPHRRAGARHPAPLYFPMGAYGGHVGRMSATDCLAVGQALRGGVIAQGIATEADYDRLYQAVQTEFDQPRAKGMLPFYLAYGQRTAWGHGGHEGCRGIIGDHQTTSDPLSACRPQLTATPRLP